jgi:hypothetical protein
MRLGPFPMSFQPGQEKVEDDARILGGGGEFVAEILGEAGGKLRRHLKELKFSPFLPMTI